MEFTILGIGILTWITFLPVLGMVAVLLLPKGSNNAIRWTSLGVTVIQVILAIVIYTRFDRALAGMQFVEQGSWIDIKSVAWFGRVHIEYFLGIDGISVVMVLLTALISCIATISSWTIDKSLKGYFALLLLLNTGMMGVFVAWISSSSMCSGVDAPPDVLPHRCLGGPRREYAAIKFFLYTLLGSVLMLLAMLALYFSTNVYIDPAGTVVSVVDAMKNGGQGLEKIHTFNLVMMTDQQNFIPDSLLGGGEQHGGTSPTLRCSSGLQSRFHASPSIPGCLTRTWKRHPISVILAGCC